LVFEFCNFLEKPALQVVAHGRARLVGLVGIVAAGLTVFLYCLFYRGTPFFLRTSRVNGFSTPIRHAFIGVVEAPESEVGLRC
jgi:hypothetical protein